LAKLYSFLCVPLTGLAVAATAVAPTAGTAMTRSALRTVVRSNLGGRTDKDTEINNGINFGLAEIVKIHPFSVLRVVQDLTVNADDLSVSLQLERLECMR